MLDALAASSEFPPVKRWAELAPRHSVGEPSVRFVTQDERGIRDAGGYDFYIRDRGGVPSREGSWHDLFNALIWLHYPATKRAIHQLQLADHASRVTPGRRTSLGDVATLFDECGVIMLSADASLFDDLRELRWRRLFFERRAELRRNTRFLVVGHALLHALLNPYIGLMGHALLVPAPPDVLEDIALSRAFADRWSEEFLAATLQRPSDLRPLPLLGVPEYVDNDSADFYDNLPEYFRTRRRAKV